MQEVRARFQQALASAEAAAAGLAVPPRPRGPAGKGQKQDADVGHSSAELSPRTGQGQELQLWDLMQAGSSWAGEGTVWAGQTAADSVPRFPLLLPRLLKAAYPAFGFFSSTYLSAQV